MIRSKFTAIIIAVVIAASASVTTVITYAVLSNASANDRNGSQPSLQRLPYLFPVPEFELTAQTGEILSSEQLEGRVWVANFIFTNCELVCPTMTANMANVEDALAEAGLDGVNLVSISVDPTHDTPEVLAEYAEQFDAGPNWRFLTGDESAIHQMVQEGFKLPVEKTPENEAMPVQHSPRFVLVDQTGMIRGYYDGLNGGVAEELVPAIQQLLEEGP